MGSCCTKRNRLVLRSWQKHATDLPHVITGLCSGSCDSQGSVASNKMEISFKFSYWGRWCCCHDHCEGKWSWRSDNIQSQLNGMILNRDQWSCSGPQAHGCNGIWSDVPRTSMPTGVAREQWAHQWWLSLSITMQQWQCCCNQQRLLEVVLVLLITAWHHWLWCLPVPVANCWGSWMDYSQRQFVVECCLERVIARICYHVVRVLKVAIPLPCQVWMHQKLPDKSRGVILILLVLWGKSQGYLLTVSTLANIDEYWEWALPVPLPQA